MCVCVRACVTEKNVPEKMVPQAVTHTYEFLMDDTWWFTPGIVASDASGLVQSKITTGLTLLTLLSTYDS